MRMFVVLPMLVLFIAPAQGAAEAVRQVKKNMPASHARVLRVQPNDPLTRDNLEQLETRSATARDVIDRLQQLHDAVLIVRAHPLLVQETQSLGRGRFWVVDGRLYGLLEYQAEPRGSVRALRVLAQQLGHALEVSLTPRGRDTQTLREVLLVRGDEEKVVSSAAVMETEFARLIGRRVSLELRGRVRDGHGLADAAGAARLQLPPLAARRIETSELPR
jgi:hypothetical protein